MTEQSLILIIGSKEVELIQLRAQLRAAMAEINRLKAGEIPTPDVNRPASRA